MPVRVCVCVCVCGRARVRACVHVCVCVHYNPEMAIFWHMNCEMEGGHTSHVNLRCVGE